MELEKSAALVEASTLRKIAEMAGVLLRESEANQDLADDSCVDGVAIRHSLHSLSQWVKSLPERGETALVLSRFQSQIVDCARCQGSTTCWLLCGAQNIAAQIVVRRRTRRTHPKADA